MSQYKLIRAYAQSGVNLLSGEYLRPYGISFSEAISYKFKVVFLSLKTRRYMVI